MKSCLKSKEVVEKQLAQILIPRILDLGPRCIHMGQTSSLESAGCQDCGRRDLRTAPQNHLPLMCAWRPLWPIFELIEWPRLPWWGLCHAWDPCLNSSAPCTGIICISLWNATLLPTLMTASTPLSHGPKDLCRRFFDTLHRCTRSRSGALVMIPPTQS